MPQRAIRLTASPAATSLAGRFAAIRAELGVPAAFPDDVLAEAQAAAREPDAEGIDLTDVPFVTVDPAGATDLDQAMCLSRQGSGYRVDYAIADVPAFVAPDGAVAREAVRRGQTIYSPDGRTPLHPPVLSEDAASLLPGRDRRALVWRFELDEHGEVVGVDLVRAVVRSRAQYDYVAVQAAADDDGSPGGSGGNGGDLRVLAGLLREIGERRQELQRSRGGASLPRPDQEVVADGGGYRLQLRPPLPAEDWNAQLSLMTGIAAASMMLKAGVGVLRTLPRPDDGAMRWFRRQARALEVPWPNGMEYGTFLHHLDATRPRHLALLHAAGALFRGAGYLSFDGDPPQDAEHAAVAAHYAHVTAPLRRLVDRFGLVVCHAMARGEDVPGWVRAALPLLPEAMAASDRLAGEVERRCVNAVEAAVLDGRVGQVFPAVVIDSDKDDDGGQVQLTDPLVLARCGGHIELGESIQVRLVEADVVSGTVRFDKLPG